MFSMPQIPRKDELLNKAFKRARNVKKTINKRDRINSIREYEQSKINTVSTVINNTLQEILDKTSKTTELDPFYYDLVASLIDIGQFKKSLAALKWVIGFNRELERKYRRRLKGAPLKSLSPIRKEYYGRQSSVIKQVEDDLIFLEDCRRRLKKLPAIKDLPTVVLAGYPNVGKSSLMKSLTGAEPKVQPYPFTTKDILIGYIDEKIQVIDTPGLLDRPVEEKNTIEKRALAALEHKANLIIFLIDPTETCGYTQTQQKSLYADIKDTFKKTPILLAMTKSDQCKKRQNPPKNKSKTFNISSKTNEGIEPLRKRLIKSIDWKTYHFKI